MTSTPAAIFVTGAGGYLARHILPAILDALPDARLKCLSLPGLGSRIACAGHRRVNVVEGDLTAGEEGIAHWLAGCDGVLHLAGYGLGRNETEWAAAFRVNVLASFQLAHAACAVGVRRFVMAQTALEYGRPSPGAAVVRPSRETDPCLPRGMYGATKCAGGQLVRSLCELAGMAFRGLRVFNTFGPGEQPHKVVPANILASLRGEALPMSRGTAVRDYVFAGDVARAFALALSKPDLSGQRVLNIGSGSGVTVADMASRVCSLIPGAPGPCLGALPDRAEEPPFLVADVAAARVDLGWEPSGARETEAALRATIEFYRSTSGEEGRDAGTVIR